MSLTKSQLFAMVLTELIFRGTIFVNVRASELLAAVNPAYFLLTQ